MKSPDLHFVSRKRASRVRSSWVVLRSESSDFCGGGGGGGEISTAGSCRGSRLLGFRRRGYVKREESLPSEAETGDEEERRALEAMAAERRML